MLRGACHRARIRATRWLAMTTKHTSAFLRRDTPGVCLNVSPNRGRGECRAPNAPAASCAKVESTRVSHHRSTGFIPAFPHAMVLTVSFVLSPVIGLSCHRHLARLLARLDAGVEASEPHDFAVRDSTARQVRAARVHRIPPRVRDDRERPSIGTGWRESVN